MAFKESFSKLAKTVGEGATTAASTIAKKSGEVIEVSKLNLSYASNEDKIYEIYEEIGKMMFEKYDKGETLDSEIKSKCRDIDRINEENKKLKKRINIIKNVKTCSKCGHEMKKGVPYCPECGLKQ